MVDITDTIRHWDQNHIIFIEGNSWANDHSGLTPPWDDNMAYSFHKYWNNTDDNSLDWIINLRNSTNVPIWLGESGENSNPWYTSLIALCEKNRIGWSWWPVKKPSINNVLNVKVNNDYRNLLSFWEGNAADPGVDAAFNAVLQFAENHKLENCTYQRDVVDAMIRQPHSTETIPYKLYNAEDTIFFTDYNLGRSSYAYLDNDSANYSLSSGSFTAWNQGWAYRSDGVDIESCTDSPVSNGYNVGWTEDGEWMEYTIEVDSTAGYTLTIRSASGGSGSKVHMELNGVAASSVITLPASSGWQNWRTTVHESVILSKGSHKIRLKIDNGGSNLNYFRFSDPVHVDSIAFTKLYAESSMDGKSISLTLNKPVTSLISGINLADFSVTCDNIPYEVISLEEGENSSNIIVIGLSEPLYYGGSIKLSCQGQNILSNTQMLQDFSAMDVMNRLPLRFTLPTRIQSEDFYFNNGLVIEACEDTGGGFDMGYAAPGDYLDYLVYVPESKYYTFTFRIATIRSSSQLIIRAGEGSSFVDVDTLIISSTGGWQTWKNFPTTFSLNREGIP